MPRVPDGYRGLVARLIRTGLVAFFFSLAGWISAGIYAHGPDVFWLLFIVFAPGALLVPHVTGTYVGESRLSFWLFVIIQIIYYHLLLQAAAAVWRLALLITRRQDIR